MHPRYGRKFWIKIVNAFERSGLEQRPFCEQQGLSLTTFQRWLYKLRAERSDRKSTALVRLKVAPSSSAIFTPVEAGLPSGIVVRFAMGTDPKYVATLVAEVEKAQCRRCHRASRSG